MSLYEIIILGVQGKKHIPEKTRYRWKVGRKVLESMGLNIVEKEENLRFLKNRLR